MRKQKPIEEIMAACTEEYRWCKHRHKLEGEHTIVDFGDGPFVARSPPVGSI